MNTLWNKWFGIGCGAALLAGLLGWASGSGRLGEERSSVERAIQTYRNFLLEVRSQRAKREVLDVELADSFDRMLGGELESVDSTLRVLLANLAGASGLKAPSVSIMRSVVVESPAKRTFRRSGSQRAYRDEPDFVEIGASMQAMGGIKEVVGFLYRLDQEPWLKRIGLVRIDPQGSEGSLRLVVQLSTIFVPGQTPGEPRLEDSPRWPLERYQGLVASNPFAPPPAPATPEVAKNPPPEPKKPPQIDPRSNWRLTGIVEDPDGVEAWLVNLPSRRTVEIRPGEAFGMFTLETAQGDIATFSVADETFRILVGSTLDRPLP